MAFDVFLSYNRSDQPTALEVGEALKERGLTVWLDVWELVPGRPWQEALEEIAATAKTAAVLVGADGIGPWQDREMRVCLSQFVKRDLSVIPVLLPGAPALPELPLFLAQMTWADLRAGITADGVGLLEWGITGVKPATLAPGHGPIPGLARGQVGAGEQPWRTLLKRVKAEVVDLLAEVDAGGPRLQIARHRVGQVGDQAGTPIPDGTGLLAWHEERGGELLLLGDAGSGKTTALFELALAALDAALNDARRPLPVILELSRWQGGDEQSFGDWIVEQVAARYRIREQRVAQWRRDRGLLLLLDGFDQVRRDHREGCLRAITHYCQAHGPVAIVIASRPAELAATLATGVELDFKAKVVLRPLAGAQVKRFLGDTGSPLERAIEQDGSVADLARTPLWLGLMSQVPAAALQGASESGSPDDLRARILDAGVDQRLENWQPGKGRRARDAGERRLRWLARTMAGRGHDDLYLEDLQPGWLDSIGGRWHYVLATRVVIGLLLAAAWIELRLLPLGLFCGLGVGLIDGALLEHAARAPAGVEVPGRRRARVVAYALAMAVCSLLSLAAVAPGTGKDTVPLVILPLITGLFFSWHGRRPVADEIRTFALSWRWAGVGIGMLPGLGVLGLALVLWWGLVATARLLIVFVALPLVVAGAVFGGFYGRRLEKDVGWRPALAIAETIRSALSMLGLALALAILFGAVAELWLPAPIDMKQTAESSEVLKRVLIILKSVPAFLPLITLVVLIFGGYDVLRHFVLRLLLAAEGRLPLACVAFLDHASRLALLRKVGRGYSFYHQVLRDHMAERDAGADDRGREQSERA